MTSISGGWATHQLAEFLAAVTSYEDEGLAISGGVERAAEAFESEIGAIVRSGRVEASVGFGFGGMPEPELLACARGERSHLEVRGVGECTVLAVPIDDDVPGVFLLGRRGEAFHRDEEMLLRAMGRVLMMACKMLRTLESERDLRAKSETQTAEIENLLTSLMERQQLLERLSKIQGSISHRKPLPEVLDAITQGAVELLGSEVVGLRLVDPDDPSFMVTLSASGVSDEELMAIRRIPVGEGAGGRAFSEDKLIVIENYSRDPNGLRVFREGELQTAMAAPVHENGAPIGSLVVASYRRGKLYSQEEKSALLSFADHVSLALTDAKTVEEMRQAQRSRDMFLAMVSHELKTPLTVIMGTLRTLERFPDALEPDQRAEMLSAAYERGRDLQRLIDRLLEGASAELADTEKEAYLPDLVSETVRGFEHSFRLKIEEVPRVTLEISSASVHRLIGILIENALSHSPSGSTIKVGANLTPDAVAVWVENEGWLPEGASEDLFQPFQRGADASSSGVGLGLYIAQRIATSMNASLTAEGRDGHVRFTLTVPLHKNSFMNLRSELGVHG